MNRIMQGSDLPPWLALNWPLAPLRGRGPVPVHFGGVTGGASWHASWLFFNELGSFSGYPPWRGPGSGPGRGPGGVDNILAPHPTGR